MHSSPASRPSRRDIVRALAPYSRSDLRKGLTIFVVDFTMLVALLATAAYATPIWLRVTAAILAGLKMNGLYTIGHDAAHHTLTPHKWLNSLIGALAYMPMLLNHRLFNYDHTASHHLKTNGPQIDVYRPMSLAEYRAAPAWRRAWERFVRSCNPVSITIYTIWHSRVEHTKFFPHKRVHPDKVRAEAWPHVFLVFAYAGAMLTWLAGRNPGDVAGFLTDLCLVLVLPLVSFLNATGLGVYLQHTHPRVPWFREHNPATTGFEQVDVTVNFRMPRWLEYLSHDAMAHQVHHVVPAIPCYHLRPAQTQLTAMLPDGGIQARPADIFAIFRACKLYDFERHQWLDFDGNATSPALTAPLRTSSSVPKQPAMPDTEVAMAG